VRLVVLNTGDELAGIGEKVEPWQIRDSNGPLLETWLRQFPWIEFVCRRHVGDRLDLVQSAIATHLRDADAILLTGGVSMGDTDFVPEAIAKLGGEVAARLAR
jgi:molybdopterin molybdotransferase